MHICTCNLVTHSFIKICVRYFTFILAILHKNTRTKYCLQLLRLDKQELLIVLYWISEARPVKRGLDSNVDISSLGPTVYSNFHYNGNILKSYKVSDPFLPKYLSSFVCQNGPCSILSGTDSYL